MLYKDHEDFLAFTISVFFGCFQGPKRSLELQ